MVAQYRRSPSIFSFFVNHFLYVHLLYHIFCVQRAAVLTLEYWNNYAGAHIWLMNSPGIGPFARPYQFPCVHHSSPTQYENRPSYTLSEALWTWLSVGGANTFRLTYKSRVMTKNWFQPYFTIVSFNWRPILYTKGFRLWMVLLFLWFLVQDFLLLNRLKRAQISVLPVFW